VNEGFKTMMLPDERHVIVPDGSDVRVLLELAGGGMAHFELPANRVSRAIAHRTVDEIWFILRGSGTDTAGRGASVRFPI
jgi:mannose-6-phosphate isomerase-like protein (cupin superfamily)